jgi:hypothetical protein
MDKKIVSSKTKLESTNRYWLKAYRLTREKKPPRYHDDLNLLALKTSRATERMMPVSDRTGSMVKISRKQIYGLHFLVSLIHP